MKFPFLFSVLVATVCIGCAGAADHHDDEHDGDALADISVTPAGPPRFAAGAIVVGEDEETAWNRECVEPAHSCRGDQTACARGQADNPDDVTDPLDTWPRGKLAGEPADASAERAKELTIAGASIWESVWNAVTVNGTKGVDLSAYASVPGYRILFECENEDETSDTYVQEGATDSQFGVKSCELRAGAFSSRSVRLIVASSNGERIWQVRMKVSPTTGKTVSTDDKIANSRSGTSISVPLQGGLRLSASFFSTGWSKAGAAGNRNQGALYLTYDQSNWMKGMPTAWQEAPLVKWTLPGSHDAGMYTHDSAGDNLAMTQTEDMTAQLELGMRYFDLRPGLSTTRGGVNLAGVKYGFNMEIVMVHGPIGGASFRRAVRDTLEFLKREGNEEIVVFDIGTGGIGDLPLTKEKTHEPAPWEALEDVVNEERSKLRLPDGFVVFRKDANKKDKEGNPYEKEADKPFGKSPKALRGAGHRLFMVRGGTLSSWNSGDYTDPEKVSPNVLNTAQACTTQANPDWIGTSLQLQATPTAQFSSNTLQGTKLVLDRRFYPWLADGNATGCVAGPAYVINDYVDNALTDVVIRGMQKQPPVTPSVTRTDVSLLPDFLDWTRGGSPALHWRGPALAMTKYNKLVRQRDGNVILYQLGRARDGSVCKESVVWKSDTERRGARLDFQDNGDFVVHDVKNDVVWKQGPAERLSLQADGNLVLYDKNGKVVWASNTAGKGTNLFCN